MNKISKYFYQYTFTAQQLAAVPAAATVQSTITVDSDADFVCTHILGYAWDTVAAAQVDFNLNFRDDSSSRDWFSQITFSQLVCSVATSQMPLPVPRECPKKSVITLTFNNPNANPVNGYISLRGYKTNLDNVVSGL